jgi:hypothetical protein
VDISSYNPFFSIKDVGVEILTIVEINSRSEDGLAENLRL